VNDDGWVTPIDVLIVINELNGNGSRELPIPPAPPLVPPPYPDVNGDLYISPIDVLQVINYLNRQAGEGESSTATVNPAAADRLFSQASGLGAQADETPLIPVAARCDHSGNDVPWRQESLATVGLPQNTAHNNSAPAGASASSDQAVAAVRPDEDWQNSSRESIGLETDLALDDLLSDIAEETTVLWN